jgi:hypothetical protein
MGYDIALLKDGAPVKVSLHEEGSNYAIGGNDLAEMTVTYNYQWFFYHFLNHEHGLAWLNGKKAGECIDRLAAAVDDLGDKPHTHKEETPHETDDTGKIKFKDKAWMRQNGGYWCDTPGNAGHSLAVLLGWAKEHPDAVFEVA